jgi:hypothetical protein
LRARQRSPASELTWPSPLQNSHALTPVSHPRSSQDTAYEDFAPSHSGQTTLTMILLLSFCPLPLLRQGALVLKNPNLSFPPVLFTKLRGREGRDSMRSKAPPPMSARVAMQFHRDGAKRSFRTGGVELSKARARGEGLESSPRCRPQAGENLRDALSIAVLDAGYIDSEVLCVLPGPVRLIFERHAAASRAIIR